MEAAWLHPYSYLVDIARRVCISYAVAIATTALVYFVARPASPGSATRVAACLGAAAALLSTPRLVIADPLREAAAVTPVVGVFSLAAFKALAFALGRGPLERGGGALLSNFPQFAAAMALPVIPSDSSSSSSSSSSASAFLLSYAVKAACAAAAASLCYLPWLHVLAAHWLYALTLSLSVGALWDLHAAAAAAVFGLRCERSFDAPWMCSSFADYWGRRWK